MAVRVKVASGQTKLLPTVQEVGEKLSNDLANISATFGEQIANLQIDVTNKAPISHTSLDTTYGVATDVEYGHVKLNTSTLPEALAVSASIGSTGKAADAGHIHPLPTLDNLGAAPAVDGGYLVIYLSQAVHY